jgi:hypothetical protein
VDKRMTDHQFKNGIEIHIPDGLTKEDELERWTDAKVAMSILLTKPPKVEVKERKPYSMKHRNAQIKRRTKTWRSPKKLK